MFFEITKCNFDTAVTARRVHSLSNSLKKLDFFFLIFSYVKGDLSEISLLMPIFACFEITQHDHDSSVTARTVHSF